MTRKKIEIETDDAGGAARRGRDRDRGAREDERAEPETYRVEDRRHWLREDAADEADEAGAEAGAEATGTRADAGDGRDEDAGGQEDRGAGSAPRQPTVLDEFRRRTEAAEQKLQEYIEAYKQQSREQDAFRARLARDLDRRVLFRFGELVGELLETVDNLDLALGHVEGVAEAEPLARGVALARDRFLAALERHGVERIVPDGRPFDPNEAEAMRIDPVDSPDRHDVVTETLQPGYRLGDHVIRAARVAVGRHQ